MALNRQQKQQIFLAILVWKLLFFLKWARGGEISSYFHVGVERLDVLQQLVGVLADERLGVVAGDVVPFDTVLVDVVQNAHTRLGAIVNVVLGVVRLRHIASGELSLVAGKGPGLVGPAGRRRVGRRHLHTRPRPEPAVHTHRLQVFAVAALEVAQSARGPDVGQVLLLKERSDQRLLGGRL